MRTWILVAVIASNGCALSASAMANHNSGGTACIESPAFAIIDVGLAAGTAAIVSATEAHDGWHAMTGLFGLSAVAGAVGAARCRGDEAEDEDGVVHAPPASNSAPVWDAEVDPAAVDISTNNTLVPEEYKAPTPHPVLHLRLPDGYQVPVPKQDDEPKIACRDNPSTCPPSQTCAIAGADAGYCVSN